ncbi:hypothetical protein YSA_11007 [Pseudomonas putida ND6]|uniref:Uncharacterized protein n=1 Tax=Pseudomonas putida ND6 TaxID=231023 RepID=I3V4R6_PSEPU|nr:hypothetical protein YSA_11007 [Pseudomonas putida ND6]
MVSSSRYQTHTGNDLELIIGAEYICAQLLNPCIIEADLPIP